MRKEETTIKMKRANLLNTIIIALIMTMFLSGCGKAENETNETDNNTISWFENSKDGGLSGTIITYDYENRERVEDSVEFRMTSQSYIGDGRYIGIIYDGDRDNNAIAIYDSKEKNVDRIIFIDRIKDEFGGNGCKDNQQILISDNREYIYFQGSNRIIRFDRDSNSLEEVAETNFGAFFVTRDNGRLYYVRNNNGVLVIILKDLETGEEKEIIRGVESFGVSQNENHIVYSDMNNRLHHYNTITEETTVIREGIRSTSEIHFSASGDRVMFTDYRDGIIPGSFKTYIYIYDLNSNETKLVHKGGLDDAIISTCWAED